jgi:hypothetical protein
MNIPTWFATYSDHCFHQLLDMRYQNSPTRYPRLTSRLSQFLIIFPSSMREAGRNPSTT